jgi:hypothetical protein
VFSESIYQSKARVSSLPRDSNNNNDDDDDNNNNNNNNNNNTFIEVV